jgi:transposase
MRQIKLAPHLTQLELQNKLFSQKDICLFKQWQIINAVAQNKGKSSEELSQVLGLTKLVLLRTVRQYNKYGEGFQTKLKWGGRRKENSFLTFEQEEEMMNTFSNKALQGQILTAKDIKKEVEDKLKREVSDDYIWDLFKRHDWNKKSPRPKHPKQDLQAQEQFKKNSRKYWLPISQEQKIPVQ